MKHNTLINSYCKKGRLKDVFYLYRIVYISGVIMMPDLVSYTALREAHRLLHRMADRGLTPDIVTYNTLI